MWWAHESGVIKSNPRFDGILTSIENAPRLSVLRILTKLRFALCDGYPSHGLRHGRDPELAPA
jgi:hypothetical protein